MNIRLRSINYYIKVFMILAILLVSIFVYWELILNEISNQSDDAKKINLYKIKINKKEKLISKYKKIIAKHEKEYEENRIFMNKYTIDAKEIVKTLEEPLNIYLGDKMKLMNISVSTQFSNKYFNVLRIILNTNSIRNEYSNKITNAILYRILKENEKNIGVYQYKVQRDKDNFFYEDFYSNEIIKVNSNKNISSLRYTDNEVYFYYVKGVRTNGN